MRRASAAAWVFSDAVAAKSWLYSSSMDANLRLDMDTATPAAVGRIALAHEAGSATPDGSEQDAAAKSHALLAMQIIAGLPKLRAFALSLSGNADRADDLVQETFLKAWMHLDSFVAGSNLGAWLFTILRNSHYTAYRKQRRAVSDSDGRHAAGLTVGASQDAHMDLLDFETALAEVPRHQREALILVGASGYTCEEASAISGCAVGTIKSRVSRARRQLGQLLSVQDAVTLRN